MSVNIDFNDPTAVRREALRRLSRREQGLPLHVADEVSPTTRRSSSDRPWPVMKFELPRPVSVALEKHEQAAVSDVFLRLGCSVKPTSQYRASNVALGIPDLWVFGPAGSQLAWWWEVKPGDSAKPRRTWSFSQAQLQWAEDCLASNILYGAGDRFAAEVFWEHVRNLCGLFGTADLLAHSRGRK